MAGAVFADQRQPLMNIIHNPNRDTPIAFPCPGKIVPDMNIIQKLITSCLQVVRCWYRAYAELLRSHSIQLACVMILLIVGWTLSLCWKSFNPDKTLTTTGTFPLQNTPAPFEASEELNLAKLIFEAFSIQTLDNDYVLDRRRQVMLLMETLEDQPDTVLSLRERTDKYDQLCMAAILLSRLSTSKSKQRLWSSIAIAHAQNALDLLPRTGATRLRFQEISLHRLLAMAQHYYQRGDVSAGELEKAFRFLDKDFLIRSGFCQHPLLQSLAEDGIIQLPHYMKTRLS